MKKALALTLAAAMAATLLAGCGGGSGSSAAASTAGGDSASAEVSGVPSYASLKVGEDYTDLKADLKLISHRTDLIADGTFDNYVAEFQKMYPGINIKYEGITDYVGDMTTRLTSNDWGDICMIPTTIPLTELGDYFQVLCQLDEIKDEYNFADNRAFGQDVYGIPSTGNAQGIVYNKAVFEAAGITELPKTPDEFLADLQLIKDKTDAIPLYTNFAAGWTMTAWDAYISGGATGDSDWMNITMPQTKDPFADRGDGTGPYAVYKILYDAVSMGLTEDDPTTTDWEGCKPMINNGEIGCMVLGSWAIVQMQAAGDNADDIAYMPFPISVNGTQYASAGADYCFGVNKNISDDNKIASMLYIKWMSESSNFAYDQGGVPVLKSQEYPETLKAFDGIALVADAQAPAEIADLQPNVNQESELSLNADQTHVQRVVEAAINGDESYDDIIADWNEAWNAAVDEYAPAK
ncbi:ABC transporter substrate-binding protein [bacterium]|nr:ABC transporter substrate-binding protein [bacterium]